MKKSNIIIFMFNLMIYGIIFLYVIFFPLVDISILIFEWITKSLKFLINMSIQSC